MKGEFDLKLPDVRTEREKELDKQDHEELRSKQVNDPLLIFGIKDEYFTDKETPSNWGVFKKAEPEPMLCPVCKEWTDNEDPCCGVEPRESYDHDDIER